MTSYPRGNLGRGVVVVCHQALTVELGESKKSVEGDFERAGVPLRLGEEESALQRGEDRDGEVVRAHAGRKVPGVVEAAQSVADCSRPLPEAGRDQGSGLRVGLGELAGKSAKRAAALALTAYCLGYHHVPPGQQSFGAAEIGALLVARDGCGW